MSDKRILDPLLVDVMARCTRLDRLSNDIHTAIRTGATPPAETAAVLEEIAGAAELCAQLTRDPACRKSGLDGAMRAASFTLRAAHEALDALIAAHHPPHGHRAPPGPVRDGTT